MSRAALVDMARDNLAHAREGTINLEPDVLRIPASHYYDPERWLRQQQALQTGTMGDVLFGRNEGGGHRFHTWVDRLLETNDEDLNQLFETGI